MRCTSVAGLVGNGRLFNLRSTLLLVVLLLLGGCQSAYYGALEQVGIHKRDVLVSRVEAAREAQEETKQQFSSALERFQAELGFDGGDLQDKYEALNAEYERSESKAEAVSERIDNVEDVAGALFEEWQEELELYSSAELRRSSESQLRETRGRYGQLIRTMRRAESRIEPVLTAFRDQVLYLKHNLNARAISSLRGELGRVEDDIAVLLREMEAAIEESDAFVRDLKATA